MHTCPMVTPGTPPVPHVGGPLTGPGVPTVLIGGMPAAVIGDMCTCVGPPDTVVLGSTGVLIGGKPAARMGDSSAHGGVIVAGCPTVLIGETSGGGAAGAASGFKVIIEALKKLPEVEVSVLTDIKHATAQKAAMTKAATSGKPFVAVAEDHDPETCSICNPS